MSNTDLQQFNGTQVFPARADVGTNADEYLIPTDGPVITAQSNNTDEGPVYPSLTRLKNYILGLRGAIVGDFMGAVRKTLYAVEVDGVGGNNSAAATGEIRAKNDISTSLGSLFTLIGDVIASSGNFVLQSTAGIVRVAVSPAQRAELRNASLRWLATATGAGDANPPQGTSIKNQLRAINTPKVAAYVVMPLGGPVGSFNGYGVSAVNVVGIPSGGHGIQVIFVDTMDNVQYTATATAAYDLAATKIAEFATEDLTQRTTSSCVFYFQNATVSGGALRFIDPNNFPIDFSIEVNGRQTT